MCHYYSMGCINTTFLLYYISSVIRLEQHDGSKVRFFFLQIPHKISYSTIPEGKKEK